jgi:hypothetical protein
MSKNFDIKNMLTVHLVEIQCFLNLEIANNCNQLVKIKTPDFFVSSDLYNALAEKYVMYYKTRLKCLYHPPQT